MKYSKLPKEKRPEKAADADKSSPPPSASPSSEATAPDKPVDDATQEGLNETTRRPSPTDTLFTSMAHGAGKTRGGAGAPPKALRPAGRPSGRESQDPRGISGEGRFAPNRRATQAPSEAGPSAAAPSAGRMPEASSRGPRVGSGSAPPHPEARHVYDDAIRAFRLMVREGKAGLPDSAGALRPTAEALLACLAAEDSGLLALTVSSTAGNYLYAHSVNVAIFAIHLGLGLGEDAEELAGLGIAALLHDAAPPGSSGKAAESPEEAETRSHTPEGGGLRDHLLAVQRVESEVLRALSAERRRGEDSDGISRNTQLLGICDVYESLSHVRPWRDALIPHEAIKALIRRPSQEFEQRFVKFFIERLSMFPPGSFVQLSTGEIGRVAGVNAKLPTRPIVEIRLRPDGTRKDPPAVMNLGRTPVVHIVRAVDETRLNVKDKKVLLQFQAARWWTE